MALQVEGKTALVTGGGSGICLEFTKLLVANGCNVLIVDLALRPEAEEVVKEHKEGKPKVLFHHTDVTNWAELDDAFQIAIKEFGRLDIVCPGAGVFEPAWSSFWNFNGGVDDKTTNSYKTIEINVTHPIRATQLAIDSFQRQKLGHGVVILVSSIAAQLAVLPTPMYGASKHAISGFTRAFSTLEPSHNIRVNAVAPGIVQTPLWTEDKLKWFVDGEDCWVTPLRVAEVMLDLIQKEEYVGGTVLEIGAASPRKVEALNDPGPQGQGMKISNIKDIITNVHKLMSEKFGK